MTFAEKRRGKRPVDDETAEAITRSMRTALNILDSAGDAQLDRLIDQLRAVPGTNSNKGKKP